MKVEEFKSLEEGDIVRHKEELEGYVVHGNYGNYVIAVRIAHLSNPNEWDLVLKSSFNHKIKED